MGASCVLALLLILPLLLLLPLLQPLLVTGGGKGGNNARVRWGICKRKVYLGEEEHIRRRRLHLLRLKLFHPVIVEKVPLSAHAVLRGRSASTTDKHHS